MSAVTSTFAALGNAVIILFIGLYGAIDPGWCLSARLRAVARAPDP
jgi:hypothetical protein